jgi:Cu-processing system ATP-binding protein
MTVSNSTMVELENTSKRYGTKTVLDDVSFKVEQGECFALLGHNGAGKTTMMKLMLGLTRPSGGEVRVFGETANGNGAAERRRQVGYLPEKVSLHETLSGREALGFYARLKGVDEASCGGLLDLVGLSDAADARIATYSKGMRQRLGLAQALLGKPRLLFLDEPTTGLDPALRLRFYELIRDLRAEGVTALISSHALTEIESRADRLVVMKQGRLVACGTLNELRAGVDLPVRMRLSVSPGRAGAVVSEIGNRDGAIAFEKVNDNYVELNCLSADKMRVVRQVSNLVEAIEDLEIMPPRLEDIYARLSGEGGPR